MKLVNKFITYLFSLFTNTNKWVDCGPPPADDHIEDNIHSLKLRALKANVCLLEDKVKNL